MIFHLLAAHALCDYALQNDLMAKAKNPWSGLDLGKMPPWYYWLAAHSLIHGGAVAVITGSVWFGVLESLLHFGIDILKCAGWSNTHMDQAAHVACKLLWSV